MAISRIFLWLGASIILYAGLMALCAIAGALMSEWFAARVFVVLAALLAAVGSIMYITVQNAPRREGAREALIFLILFWICVPIITSLPFSLLGAAGNLTQSYFESVSALTTTGASTLVPEDLPKSLLLWRAALQWSGGCFVATFAVVILAALNLRGTGVHRSVFFTLQKGELFSRLIDIGRLITTLYLAISAVCFIALLITGTQMIDALCLSLSAVSTGGLTPRSGPLHGYLSNAGGVILAFTCLLGAANVSILWDVVRRRRFSAIKDVFTNVEHRGALVMMAILVVSGFIYTGYAHVFTFVLESMYFVSTAGFDFHVIGVDMMPPSLLIAIALIGGSALSTAGGLKIIRILLLLRHMRTDLDRMSHPSRVRPVRFEGRIIEDKAFLSIWMYFFGYTLVFALGIFALGASGVSFTYAVSACASALSNIGPLLGATYPEFTYSQMNNSSLGILTIIMLLGRVEVLAALAALSPSLWR